MRWIVALVALTASLAAGSAAADAPAYLPVQGTLAGLDGTPVSGDTSMRFALYSADVGGTELWNETQWVSVENGQFTAFLGDSTTLDLSLFRDHGTVYLGIAVGGEPELSRFQIATTGYAAFAQFAGDAATLGGHPASAFAPASSTYAWSDLTGIPPGFADGTDDTGPTYTASAPISIAGTVISLSGVGCTTGYVLKWNGGGWACLAESGATYSAGAGLTLSGTQFSIPAGAVTSAMIADGTIGSADINNTQVQQRVTGSCAAGSAVRVVNADGSVACETTGGSSARPVVATSSTGATTNLGSSCVNYSGGTVTITATGAGTIIVEANAFMQLTHAAGTADSLILTIGTTATDCGDLYTSVYWTIPAGYPADSYTNRTFTVRRPFSVGAGTYTYYLNGYMTSGGAGDDHFWYASMQAVFYPS